MTSEEEHIKTSQHIPNFPPKSAEEEYSN